jgi:hypothetical protein
MTAERTGPRRFGVNLGRFAIDPDDPEEITEAEIVDDPAPADVPDGTGPGPAPGTVDLIPDAGPATVARSLPEIAGTAAGLWLGGVAGAVADAVADARAHPDGFAKGVYLRAAYGHGDSWAEHAHWVLSNSGVPENSRDGLVIPGLNAAFHIFIGAPLHAASDVLRLCGTRPVFFFGLLGLIGLIILIVHVTLG